MGWPGVGSFPTYFAVGEEKGMFKVGTSPSYRSLGFVLKVFNSFIRV